MRTTQYASRPCINGHVVPPQLRIIGVVAVAVAVAVNGGNTDRTSRSLDTAVAILSGGIYQILNPDYNRSFGLCYSYRNFSTTPKNYKNKNPPGNE